MSATQVQNVLRFIDEAQSEAVKRAVFGRLGRECFYTRNLDEWIDQFTDNPQAYLDRVNIEHKSPFWSRLEFADDRTLVLTGKKGDTCACAFAACARPPQSLCNHCCKAFQEELFGRLFGAEVEVTITESHLLGGERCSTVIRMV
jgi:hypothetical protein